jgi:hypothetical protein
MGLEASWTVFHARYIGNLDMQSLSSTASCCTVLSGDTWYASLKEPKLSAPLATQNTRSTSEKFCERLSSQIKLEIMQYIQYSGWLSLMMAM